jgi:hypothetical protein
MTLPTYTHRASIRIDGTLSIDGVDYPDLPIVLIDVMIEHDAGDSACPPSMSLYAWSSEYEATIDAVLERCADTPPEEFGSGVYPTCDSIRRALNAWIGANEEPIIEEAINNA